jgi:hypothetical protein
MYQTVEKRYQMRAEGISISAIVVLTPSEQEILECKDLEKSINNIATDLHVAWAVEINGDIATATISKQFGPVVGDEQSHEVEIAATNFMGGIRKLQVPSTMLYKKDPNEKVIEEELAFARSILDSTWDETEEEMGIKGAKIIAECKSLPICIPCGQISKAMLRRMFESYVKVYGHEHE